ncbi:MAG: hypothetical protein U9Q70_05225 [Chloroflexota bacterium]|nr:hypothetical protein [Chloroflexota bacterium]
MKDTKIPIGWLIPIVGVILLLGWFLGRSGWNVTEVDGGIVKLAPPTATIIVQPTVPIQETAQQPTALPITSPPLVSESTKGKYPCPLVIGQSEVDAWQVGQASVPTVQEAINQFDAKRPYDEGAFAKGTKIPSGVLVVTNFDERDANAWTQYPVVPLIHSGSWGLFQTTGEYTAPNAGACMTIVP